MRIEIEIPKKFEGDYVADKFKDFFSRLVTDKRFGMVFGNYEFETAEMLLKAFDESKEAYNAEAVVAELEKQSYWSESTFDVDGSCNDDSEEVVLLCDAIKAVRKGGKEE